MAKLVDALVSGSSAERHAGSIPVPGTKIFQRNLSVMADSFFCK